jgi:glycosyltransferase-like protein
VVPSVIVRYEPIDAPFDVRVAAMLEAYRDGLVDVLHGFDLIHSQDCLSANAALALRDEGRIGHVIRTVHHVDAFTSPSLIECQNRSILEPDALLCVSAPWVTRLADEFGRSARLVRNGVDTRRFRPSRDLAERERDHAAVGFGERLVVLTIGGIEPRKGSLTLLEAFAELCASAPRFDPVLVIAGGATLFDYRHEVERFEARVRELGVGERVRVLGSVGCEELERLYRAADLFAFPSTTEGFGLAALEAVASGLPVVASDIDALQTFLEHERSALLAPVGDSSAFAAALARLAEDVGERDRLRAGGLALAAGFSWDAAAAANERVYTELLPLLDGVRRGAGAASELRG